MEPRLENNVRMLSEPVQKAIRLHPRKLAFQEGVTIFIQEDAFHVVKEEACYMADKESTEAFMSKVRKGDYWNASQEGVRPMVHYNKENPIVLAEITNFFSMDEHLQMVKDCGPAIPVHYVVVRKNGDVVTYEDATKMLDEMFVVKK